MVLGDGVQYQSRVRSLELRTENNYEVESTRLIVLWSFILNVFSASSVSMYIYQQKEGKAIYRVNCSN